MQQKMPRLAARALIVEQGKVLLVNAFADLDIPLMCLPGGGAHSGSSLPENLAREVFEETGLTIEVGAPCLVNEFHDPDTGFHQVEIFFKAQISKNSARPDTWDDPEHIVARRIWADANLLERVPHKPSSLAQLAFGDATGLSYDPLETIWKP